MKIVGLVDVLGIKNNKQTVITQLKNLVTYEGYDALSKIMSGNLSSRINALFIQFDYNGPGIVRSTALTDSAADYRALAGDLDYLRIPIGTGVLSASSVNYTSNKALFVGSATFGMTGVVTARTFSASSAIEKIGLGIVPDWNDSTKDLLYASLAPTSVITVSTLDGIAFRWQTQFTA